MISKTSRKPTNPLPIVQAPIVDKLAYLLPWGVGAAANQERLMLPIKQRIASATTAGRCKRAYITGARYRENFHIVLDSGTEALVQIGALQPARQHGGIRVTVNPSRFKAGDADQLNKVMQRIVGPTYDSLMQKPLLNCVDFAIDITHVRLERMLVAYSNASRHTTFGKRIGKGAHIEGYNFGSVKSDYMAVAYDKHQERVHRAILELAKQGVGTEVLKANVVKQLERVKYAPHVVRVEVRGKKLRGLPLCKLDTLTNRFARFQFADLTSDGSGLDSLTEAAFRSLCRDKGVKATLELFTHSKQQQAVNAYWNSRRATWWQPQSHWLDACAALRKIGLFPDSAFNGSQPSARSGFRRVSSMR